MGGFGSGSWRRWDKRSTVEERRQIDVRRWQREGLFEATPRYISWAWYRQGEQIASISARTSNSEVELSYAYRRNGDEDNEKSVNYTIPLSWTECNFGGKRAWFICPGVVKGRVCGRRVAKLYLGGGYFLCRHCHDLSYNSRQVGRKNRALHKCQKIRRRLGASANMLEPFPPPPKGMHLKTYMGLWLEHYRAEREHLEAMRADIDKLQSQLSRFGSNGNS
jgi:hypothetical protein